MSQTVSSKTFLAADGKWYTTDGKYVLENNVWVSRQSAGVRNTSSQQDQSSRAQSGSSLRPAAPPIDVDPSFRIAKDRHIMVGAFVDALDTISGRKR